MKLKKFWSVGGAPPLNPPLSYVTLFSDDAGKNPSSLIIKVICDSIGKGKNRFFVKYYVIISKGGILIWFDSSLSVISRN